MRETNITVLKFGGSVLRNEDDLSLAVHEIYRHWRRGEQVLAVVSAFGGTTDTLLDRAKSIDNDPQPEALATLLLTGEATSAALLGLALKRSGVPAKILTPEQVGILTEGDPLDAQPVAANVERLRSELEKAVVVVSGFAGVKTYGDLTLLGRGGTDFTALFLAQKLAGKCILVKDVDGLYEFNPTESLKRPRKFSRATYQKTLEVGGELIQPKAVRFAELHRQVFEVAALVSNEGTTIGAEEDLFHAQDAHKGRPLRVALLGCGTVGGGVYKQLAALPDKFEIAGVANLDPTKAIATGIRKDLIVNDAAELIERDTDVVIELIGGVKTARRLIKYALGLRRHVITANKALLAEAGVELEDYARRFDVTLRYSASVGGALPALESITRLTRASKPIAVRGIINGTANFICDQLASGVDLNAAVDQARREGFAESDPRLDLDGTDAAQKLVLIARASFGVDLSFNAIRRTGIEALEPSRVREAASKGHRYRLIAECRRTAAGIDASVRPIEIRGSDPFALTEGAENCLLIEGENGKRTFLRGRGAGRYPTAEAVIADLFDLRNEIGNGASQSLSERLYREAQV